VAKNSRNHSIILRRLSDRSQPLRTEKSGITRQCSEYACLAPTSSRAIESESNRFANWPGGPGGSPLVLIAVRVDESASP
jgi:hypothetical protein